MKENWSRATLMVGRWTSHGRVRVCPSGQSVCLTLFYHAGGWALAVQPQRTQLCPDSGETLGCGPCSQWRTLPEASSQGADDMLTGFLGPWAFRRKPLSWVIECPLAEL